MGKYRYIIIVRRKGGKSKDFELISEYALAWFVGALKQVIEKDLGVIE